MCRLTEKVNKDLSLKKRKLLSQRHPALYFVAVWTRRLIRYCDWYLGNKRYSNIQNEKKLPFRVKKHQSVLLKKLGDSDMQLQINKITNLKIASKKITGYLIQGYRI